VADAGTGGVAGEALRIATADGIRAAVFTIAGGIVATFLITLSLRARYEPTTTTEAT
jgi:hypothetical protein